MRDGDKVLARISQTISAKLRSADVIGRYGGDEFVIMLPHTNAQKAISLAKSSLISIASLQFDTGDALITVTISIRISQTINDSTFKHEITLQSDTAESPIKRADQAMYSAK